MTNQYQIPLNMFVVKLRRRWGILFFLTFLAMIYLILMFDIIKIPHINSWQKRDDLKYILFWNKYYDYPYFSLADRDGQAVFVKHNCPVNTCYLTETSSLMSVDEFDALIFHVNHFQHPSRLIAWSWQFLPRARSPHQRYVFFLFESPIYMGGSVREWNNFFNWTWTYRLDSDIPSPYARILPANSSDFYPVLPPVTWMKPDDRVEVFYELAKEKSRAVAWLVSHCQTQSKREEYVRVLSTYIPVDQFGDCGGQPWPKKDSKGFYAMLNKEYKFYLSFENSLCEEYVTEKFFHILRYDVVPIVYGGADYKAIAPPMSYINALDYESPRKLAEYLLYLDKNPQEFSKYFWWKRYYIVSRVKVPQFQSLCRLCEMLHEDASHISYDDLQSWWTTSEDGKPLCKEPRTISPT